MKAMTRIAALMSTLTLVAGTALSQDAAPQQVETTQSLMNRASAPTDVPRPMIFRRDENGKVIRLTQLADILALKANPTVGPRSVELIMPVHYGRRARFELLLISNLDLYWMATDGRLNNVNLGNMKELSQLTEMMKPLVAKTSFTDEIQNRGILTRTQAAMNRHIVNEYKTAIQSEIQFSSDAPLADLMRFILMDSLTEANLAYQSLIVEMMENLDVVVKNAGLGSSSATTLASLKQELSENPEERVEQYKAVNDAFRKLSVDEGIAVLQATRELREHKNISPMIQEIDVMHAGKVIASDKQMFEGSKITTADGEVIDPAKVQSNYDIAHDKLKVELMEEAKNVGNGSSKKSDD